ncbi:MAG: ABC transporter substrate-binding protein [Clostridiales Family XIII bacterium]|jgi:branched-chain amino acid transport system substrate-binding protein|nr:ABC transporter substrate-binding protein [Clostridiales Family XIII bacterium]
MFAFSGCGGAAPPASGDEDSSSVTEPEADGWQETDRQSIVVGGVRSQTGANAIFEQTAFGPQYKMWIDELNKDGGIYIPSIGKKLPAELKIYDDKSDAQTMVRLYEQLCIEEKVDILLPPVTNMLLLAAAPIAQKYGYLMIAGEGAGTEVGKVIAGTPNVFTVLNFSQTQIPAIAELFKTQGVTSVFCVYVDDLLGAEYWGAARPALEEIGVEIKGEYPIPSTLGVDMSLAITAAEKAEAQAFLTFCYPDQDAEIAANALEAGYNPDLYLMGPGGSYDSSAGFEGIMGIGAWNEKSSERAREYSEHFKSYWIDKGEFWRNEDGTPNPEGTVYQDWWGHICYYSVCQIYQQAIENAGEFNEDGIIDNAKLVSYVKANEFDTVLNEHLRFSNNTLAADMYLGQIGQWQSGVFEVIDASEHRTADPVIPKPEWKK